MQLPAGLSAAELTNRTAGMPAQLLADREGVPAGTVVTVNRWTNAGFRGMEASITTLVSRRSLYGVPADMIGAI